MPPKKDIIYPRYFQGSLPEDKNTVIVFPAEGSLGTAYYIELGRWSTPSWTLDEMNIAPEDFEIVRWQAIALGVPGKLPPFKAVPRCDL
jgi:hypothetical protein